MRLRARRNTAQELNWKANSYPSLRYSWPSLCKTILAMSTLDEQQFESGVMLPSPGSALL